MPEMDGVETLQRLRKLDGYENVPVVILTANAVAGSKERYLDMGFRDYLSKPLDPVAHVLAAALREEVVAGIAGDADDVRMNSGLVLDAPERHIVGMIAVADHALRHHPFAAITHQKKNLFVAENNAARTTANCTCHSLNTFLFTANVHDSTKTGKLQ